MKTLLLITYFYITFVGTISAQTSQFVKADNAHSNHTVQTTSDKNRLTKLQEDYHLLEQKNQQYQVAIDKNETEKMIFIAVCLFLLLNVLLMLASYLEKIKAHKKLQRQHLFIKQHGIEIQEENENLVQENARLTEELNSLRELQQADNQLKLHLL